MTDNLPPSWADTSTDAFLARARELAASDHGALRTLRAAGTPAPVSSTSTLREQVWAALESAGVAHAQLRDHYADSLMPLFASVIAEAEQRGRAEGWDEGKRAQYDFARGFRGITIPTHPYTPTPETEQ